MGAPNFIAPPSPVVSFARSRSGLFYARLRADTATPLSEVIPLSATGAALRSDDCTLDAPAHTGALLFIGVGYC